LKPLALYQALTKALVSAFGAPAATTKEQELTRVQAVQLAIEASKRADLAIGPADNDALADTLDAMTGAREVLELELFGLLELPPAPAAESATSSPSAPEAPPATPANPEHVPGTNGAAAAYTMEALAKANAGKEAPANG
jgi:hypothetical protein